MFKIDEKLIETEKKQVAKILSVDKSEIKFNNTGWESRVYIVGDGKYVFKFPRWQDDTENYDVEEKVYKLLQKYSISTPKIRWVGDNYSYIGYEGIVGTSLQNFDHLSSSQRQSVGKQIGEFLKEFHQESIAGFKVEDKDKDFAGYQEKFELGKEELIKNLTTKEVGELESLICDELPRKMNELDFEMRLGHGDMGPWNVILKNDGSIGIIDFSDVRVIDTSRDLASFYDNIVTDAVLETYGDSEILRKRIAYRQRFLPFLELPFFVGRNDPEGAHEQVKKIRKLLN